MVKVARLVKVTFCIQPTSKLAPLAKERTSKEVTVHCGLKCVLAALGQLTSPMQPTRRAGFFIAGPGFPRLFQPGG
jgi:hypothetical protein